MPGSVGIDPFDVAAVLLWLLMERATRPILVLRPHPRRSRSVLCRTCVLSGGSEGFAVGEHPVTDA